MPVVWTKPSIEGAAQFATWDGSVFGLVREMADGRWRCSVFPDGQSDRGMDALAGSEFQAKRWVERWAEHHHGAIKPSARQRMPHEGKSDE